MLPILSTQRFDGDHVRRYYIRRSNFPGLPLIGCATFETQERHQNKHDKGAIVPGNNPQSSQSVGSHHTK